MRDEDRLRRIIHELSSRVNIPSPKVVLKESNSRRVTSIGWWGAGKIIVSSGFMNLSHTDREIEGVLAHELVHIRERHQDKLAAFLFLIALVRPLVTFGGSSTFSWMVSDSLLELSWLDAILIGSILSFTMVFMRHCERRADEGAARFTDPTFLIQALERLESHSESPQTFWGRIKGLWARITHRTVEERIAHLKRRSGGGT